MKKITILLIITAFIFIGCSNKTNGEKYIKEEKELYEKASEYIEDKIEKEDIDNKDKEGYKVFIGYDGLGMTEKGENKYAYMWILSEAYYLKDGKPEHIHSSSMFYKIKFKDGKVVKYENPEDGSNYKKSIEKMCIDNQMVNKIINYDLKFNNDKKIKKYYSNL